MFWKLPPRIKIYEALGCISDDRILVDGNTGVVISSSGLKRYQVQYNPNTNAITSNDNGSYYQGYLGYPAIAFLLVKRMIPYENTMLSWLEEISWKDINQKHKNDFQKTEERVRQTVIDRGGDLLKLDQVIDRIAQDISELNIKKLKSNLKPPEGY